MKQIILTQNKVTLVDDADFEKASQMRWIAVRDGRSGKFRAKCIYRQDGQRIAVFLHRWLMGNPVEYQVDHRDRDPLNNQRKNLRVATHGQNQQNQSAQKNNKLGIKGVFYIKSKRLYRASISANKIHYHLGYFKTVEDATRAYDLKALELHGEFAVPNVLKGNAMGKRLRLQMGSWFVS